MAEDVWVWHLVKLDVLDAEGKVSVEELVELLVYGCGSPCVAEDGLRGEELVRDVCQGGGDGCKGLVDKAEADDGANLGGGGGGAELGQDVEGGGKVRVEDGPEARPRCVGRGGEQLGPCVRRQHAEHHLFHPLCLQMSVVDCLSRRQTLLQRLYLRLQRRNQRLSIPSPTTRHCQDSRERMHRLRLSDSTED